MTFRREVRTSAKEPVEVSIDLPGVCVGQLKNETDGSGFVGFEIDGIPVVFRIPPTAARQIAASLLEMADRVEDDEP